MIVSEIKEAFRGPEKITISILGPHGFQFNHWDQPIAYWLSVLLCSFNHTMQSSFFQLVLLNKLVSMCFWKRRNIIIR